MSSPRSFSSLAPASVASLGGAGRKAWQSILLLWRCGRHPFTRRTQKTSYSSNRGCHCTQRRGCPTPTSNDAHLMRAQHQRECEVSYLCQRLISLSIVNDTTLHCRLPLTTSHTALILTTDSELLHTVNWCFRRHASTRVLHKINDH